MHRLADEVFAQHRSQDGPAIAIAREGREAGALELNVAKDSIAPSEFSDQDGAPVAQPWHEGTELVPRVGHRDLVCIVRQSIAGKHCRRLTRYDHFRPEAAERGTAPRNYGGTERRRT